MPFAETTTGTAIVRSIGAGVFSDTFTVSGANVAMIAIELVAGTVYEIDVDNGTSGDLFLRIFDQFGVEVKANDDGSRSSDNVIFSASPYTRILPSVTGLYYVAVSAFYLNAYDPATEAGRAAPENPVGFVSGSLTISDVGAGGWGSADSIVGIGPEGSSDLTDLLRDHDRSGRTALAGAINASGDIDMSRVDLTKGDVLVVDVNGLTGNGTMLRIFDEAGVTVGSDDDSGTGLDPQLIFAAPSSNDFYIGISGEGNSIYNGLTGATTLPGATGGFEVIVHLNPTQIGNALGNLFSGDDGENYIVTLSGNDTASGGDGNDTVAGGDDADEVRGGNGRDQVYGEQGDDNVRGDNGTDVLSGGQGNDKLDGGQGNDLGTGGAGNDTLLGGSGTGDDTLRGDAGNDTVTGGGGTDSLFGGAEDDLLNGGDGDDRLFGDDGNDSLLGGAGRDAITGGFGLDTIVGGADGDVLSGGDDADLVFGGAGNDLIIGSTGNDTLHGDSGADVFRFSSSDNGVDTITDLDLTEADEGISLGAIFDATGAVVTAQNMAQFIQTTSAGSGADAFLAVDADGLVNGLSFTIIAVVEGVTAAQLFDFDNFFV